MNKLEQVHTSTKRSRVVLYAKYKNVGLNKVMGNQFQNLTEAQRKEFIELVQEFE